MAMQRGYIPGFESPHVKPIVKFWAPLWIGVATNFAAGGGALVVSLTGSGS